MRIAVVGAGALGCLFGGKMVLQGYDVVFYDEWNEQVRELNSNGLTILEEETDQRVFPISATNDFRDIKGSDIAFIFVKSYDNAHIIPELKKYTGPDTRIVTMQNGLGNAELIASFFGEDRTLVGVTFQGGTLIKPGTIEHKAFGPTSLANYNREADGFLLSLSEILNRAGFVTEAYDSVDNVIWTKLVQNSAYNALTAITRLQAARSISDSAGRRIVEMVIDEVVAIAKHKGLTLHFDDPVRDSMALINEKMPDVITSMFSDILKRRRTEIDSLNGAVVREGKALGIPVPANEMLTNLIKVIESNYDNMLWTLPG